MTTKITSSPFGWSQVFTSHHSLLSTSVKTPLLLSLQTTVLRAQELNRIRCSNSRYKRHSGNINISYSRDSQFVHALRITSQFLFVSWNWNLLTVLSPFLLLRFIIASEQLVAVLLRVVCYCCYNNRVRFTNNRCNLRLIVNDLQNKKI